MPPGARKAKLGQRLVMKDRGQHDLLFVETCIVLKPCAAVVNDVSRCGVV